MKWEEVKLGDTATFINGYPFKPTDWSTTGKEIIRIQNLTKSNGIEANRYEGIIQERYLVKKGDLLISWSGTLGVYEWGGDDAWLNQHIFKVVFDKAEVNKNYFKFLIQSKLHELEQQVHGATMKHITKGKFDNIKVPLPPLHIQEQIADTLDKADALRRKDQELLTKYDKLAQAIFYDMFGDPVKNNKGWNIKTVIEVADCIVPGRDKPKSFTGSIPWVTTDDLKHLGTTNCSKKNIGLSDTEIKEVRAKIIPKDSVIMTCVGDLGIISIAGINMVINQQLHAFQPKDINPTFLMYALSLRKDYMIKMASSTTVPYMNKTVCNSIPIIIPPKEMQEKFTSIYSGIKRQVELCLKSSKNSSNLSEMLTVKYFS